MSAHNGNAPSKIEESELTPQQIRAIALLVSGKNQGQVAEEIGIVQETLSRWKRNHPAFIAAYNEARRQQWESAVDGLDALAVKALQALGDLMDSSDPNVRLKAVGLWLSHRRSQASFGPTDIEAILEDKRRVEVEREKKRLWDENELALLR